MEKTLELPSAAALLLAFLGACEGRGGEGVIPRPVPVPPSWEVDQTFVVVKDWVSYGSL